MKIAGIVCEYNPFHNGHAYQIEETRRILGQETTIVSVMSGNFVQRGDVAMYGKHSRAKAAVLEGVDLVLELPVPWALSSAENFALGAVAMLKKAGCTHISFGSECADTGALCAAAAALSGKEFDEKMKKGLVSGDSYAAVRQHVLEETENGLRGITSSPNDILAVEYIKAIRTLGADMKPLAIQRTGVGHDGGASGSMASASYIRKLILAGEDPGKYMPKQAEEVFAGEKMVSIYDYEEAILSRLRMLDEEAFSQIPGGGEGFYRRFMKCCRSETCIDAILEKVKTKRYAMSRIRRMMFCAALGITRRDSEKTPPYLRVLAAGAGGRKILREITETPVIVKPSSAYDLGGECLRIFEKEAAADDFYALARHLPCGTTWTISPFIAK